MNRREITAVLKTPTGDTHNSLATHAIFLSTPNTSGEYPHLLNCCQVEQSPENGTECVSLSSSLEHCTREESPLSFHKAHSLHPAHFQVNRISVRFMTMNGDKDLDSRLLENKLQVITAEIRS